MKTLIQLQHQLQTGSFEFTRHAFKRAVERNISDLKIIESGANVTIIEDYPDDKYSPSCLLLARLYPFCHDDASFRGIIMANHHVMSPSKS